MRARMTPGGVGHVTRMTRAVAEPPVDPAEGRDPATVPTDGMQAAPGDQVDSVDPVASRGDDEPDDVDGPAPSGGGGTSEGVEPPD